MGAPPPCPRDLSLSAGMNDFAFWPDCHCRRMERLGRRIEQRRDATRAPRQDRNGWRSSDRPLVSPPHHLRVGKNLSSLSGPPQPGQTRLQLVETNAALFRELVPRIFSAAPDALLLVVSNPVDVLTYISLHVAGVAPERVFGSGTVLDTSRFRSLLAHRLDVAVGNVHAYILGEHGDSEVPIWSSAQVGGAPLNAVAGAIGVLLNEADRHEIEHGVRDAAAQVIAAKGATNWAVGLAVARILEAIVRDENRILTVSSMLLESTASKMCVSLYRDL